jgi:hypothetical protein
VTRFDRWFERALIAIGIASIVAGTALHIWLRSVP